MLILVNILCVEIAIIHVVIVMIFLNIIVLNAKIIIIVNYPMMDNVFVKKDFMK